MAAAAWDVTADVHKFSDAVSWFQKRTVLTATDALALNERARGAAFWVGGGLQLQQVQDVFQALDKSIAKGETFEEFRKRLKVNLKPGHASIVFRNATQRAYNAGRYQQMTQPDVLQFRPFWMYDSVLDSRTTPLCSGYNGTVLPATDTWWLTRVPPNHHGCRAGIRSLRRAEAERRGITVSPSDSAPSEGWSTHPMDPFGPPEGKDIKLVAELKKKRVSRVKLVKPGTKPSLPTELPVEHTVEHWVTHYGKRYGEAAQSLGWGRAMLERGLDMPAREFADQWPELGVNSLAVNRILSGEKTKTLRELGADLLPEVQIAAASVKHSQVLTRSKLVPKFSGLENAPQFAIERELFERRLRLLVDARVQPIGVVVDVVKPWKDARESQYGSRIEVFPHTAAHVLLHEWAHAIEEQSPLLGKRSKAFLAARRRDEPLRKLSKLTGLNYRPEELAFEDQLRDAYVGKEYRVATEVTSMGVEFLTRSRDYNLSYKDIEHLLFTLGQLSGQ